jgi:hypothetical protein
MAEDDTMVSDDERHRRAAQAPPATEEGKQFTSLTTWEQIAGQIKSTLQDERYLRVLRHLITESNSPRFDVVPSLKRCKITLPPKYNFATSSLACLMMLGFELDQISILNLSSVHSLHSGSMQYYGLMNNSDTTVSIVAESEFDTAGELHSDILQDERRLAHFGWFRLGHSRKPSPLRLFADNNITAEAASTRIAKWLASIKKKEGLPVLLLVSSVLEDERDAGEAGIRIVPTGASAAGSVDLTCDQTMSRILRMEAKPNVSFDLGGTGGRRWWESDPWNKFPLTSKLDKEKPFMVMVNSAGEVNSYIQGLGLSTTACFIGSKSTALEFSAPRTGMLQLSFLTGDFKPLTFSYDQEIFFHFQLT